MGHIGESTSRRTRKTARRIGFPTLSCRSGPVLVHELWKIEPHDGILALLKQLHPNPQMDMVIDSGDSRGAWACLRAYNAQFAEIAFRIHAHFVLEDGFFTPSQFAGKLIIAVTMGKSLSSKCTFLKEH